MRKKIVAGNWKMNLDYQEGISLFSEIMTMARDELRGEQELIICSPFVHLNSLAQLGKDQQRVAIGAQNIHHEDSGAYTGEVSARQVASVGATYVIIGHSERRLYAKEDTKLLSKKIQQAMKHHLRPIFCVGETQSERESGQFMSTIENQLIKPLEGLSAEEMEMVVLAYEPVWAIGTGYTATPQQAQEVHAYIRKTLSKCFSEDIAQRTSILYGGSCKPSNAEALFSQIDIDGGLIGGASLKSRDFINIARVFG